MFEFWQQHESRRLKLSKSPIASLASQYHSFVSYWMFTHSSSYPTHINIISKGNRIFNTICSSQCYINLVNPCKRMMNIEFQHPRGKNHGRNKLMKDMKRWKKSMFELLPSLRANAYEFTQPPWTSLFWFSNELKVTHSTFLMGLLG